jgi:hypothetical protein
MKKNKLNFNRQPAQELAPDINSKIFYKTLIITILVLFSLNLFSSQLLKLFSPNGGYKLIQTKWDILNRLEKPVDILIIGDSSGNQGIDTDLIQQKTGKPALNLSSIGNVLALNDHWMLIEYIKKFGQPPECVISIHVYDVWHEQANHAVIAQIPLNPIQMLSNLHQAGLDFKFQKDYLLAKYIPSWSENTSLKRIIMHPWKAKRLNIPLSSSGFQPWPNANPKNVLKDIEEHKKFVQQHSFKPSEENTYALKQMAALSEREGFSLTIVNSPMVDVLYEEKDLKHYLSNVNKFIGEISINYDNMHHLFTTPETFSASVMQNADHLTTEAAKRYTLRLLENLECNL